MMQYSHFMLASFAEPQIKPEDPADYYWGAMFPDVRYLAHLKRSDTHFPQERMVGWASQYPHLKSFIQGYRVHCLVDEIEFANLVGSKFPLPLVQFLRRKKFSYQQIVVLTELYFVRKKTGERQISAENNEIIESLGISQEQTMKFANAIRKYIAAPEYIASLDQATAVAAFQELGILDDTRIERYMGAARLINKSPFLLNILLLSVRNAHLEQCVVDTVAIQSW